MRLTDDINCVLTQEYTDAEIHNYTGSFCGFVLLSKDSYDLRAFADRLEAQWNITPLSVGQEGRLLDATSQDLILDISGALVSVSLFYEPIPLEEGAVVAEQSIWTEAGYAVRMHRAHLMVAVLPAELKAMEAACIYCEMIDSALKDSSALAVYTSGTILDPLQFQYYTMKMVEEKRMPLENLFYIGTYMRSGGICGYTVGLDAFGIDELEVLDSSESKENLISLLQQCISLLLQEGCVARWYFKIVWNDCIWEGRRKDGVMVEGHSIQLTRVFE